MSTVVDGICTGISSNPDISGPGVRIALYLQSLLSVLLVRFSPDDAPGAYWSMTSTAFSLIVSAIVTSAKGEISLLDGIVVVYVLILPILVSAFGLSEIVTPQSKKNATRSVHSPLLIVANWTRSALTYSFALYVWISAPTFGQGPPECNAATRLIFFGASLPALGSGRWLNLAGWGILTFFFVWRTIKGRRTILISFEALFSKRASQALLKAKHSPKNEVHSEVVTRTDFATGKVTQTNRLFRPRQIFHELLQGMTSHILSLAPSGSGSWYRLYGRSILVGLLAVWAIIMTELELRLNTLSMKINSEWGFGQILPLLLTISPLFSLYEAILSRQSAGPLSKPRRIRFTIRRASNLRRPHCELDPYPQDYIQQMDENEVKKIRSPSAFAIATIDEREMYTTYDESNTTDPVWEESFDVEIDDQSTAVIRVFDSKCIDRGWPAFIGYTVIHPFTVFSHPTEPQYTGDEDPDKDDASAAKTRRVEVTDVPLVCDGVTMQDMTISISLSSDTSLPPSLHNPAPILRGPESTHRERRVALVKFGNKRMGRKKETTTQIGCFTSRLRKKPNQLKALAKGDCSASLFAETLVIDYSGSFINDPGKVLTPLEVTMLGHLESALRSFRNIKKVIWEVGPYEPSWMHDIILKVMADLSPDDLVILLQEHSTSRIALGAFSNIKRLCIERLGGVCLTDDLLSQLSTLVRKSPELSRLELNLPHTKLSDLLRVINGRVTTPLPLEHLSMVNLHVQTFDIFPLSRYLLKLKSFELRYTSRNYRNFPLYRNMWDSFLEDKIHLSRLSIHCLIDDLFIAYLESFVGLEYLHLFVANSAEAESLVPQTSLPLLRFVQALKSHHASSLLELNLEAGYEAREWTWPFPDDVLTLLSSFRDLRLFGITLKYPDEMGNTSGYRDGTIYPLIAFCEGNFRKLQTLELHTSLSWPFHPWRARAQHDYFGHRGLRGSSRPFINKIFEDAIVTYRSDHDSLCAEFQIHYEGNVYVRNAPTETDSRSFYILQQQ
ncbi:hypothetical protein CVT26_010474 [Gymnopilus dilepis]|uniref:C2 domain-containing protein n=1 Tax=Gymnopilus dilepis TaxID=231916 RepID=A0A409Y0D8_9AGAR|nr:hypothetical protein CVT26_010474 [Gymnopilus dilepis]